MSRMADLDIEIKNLERGWVWLVAELFQRQGYRVQREVVVGPDRRRRADLVADRQGQRTIVELRMHRSPRIPRALIRNSFEQLNSLVLREPNARGLLIITQPLERSYYEVLNTGNVELWDINELEIQTADYPELSSSLAELIRSLRVFADTLPSEPDFVARQEESLVEAPVGAGSALASKLETIRAGRGKAAASAFEKLCEEALRLLFGADLIGWRSQSSIDEGFQRVDLIARLVPTLSSFWATLASDFRTRYVVFEFKNYRGKINQDQVYTTEKYLYTQALRSVAVIIARSGKNESADRAIRGALREQGKLMLCVSMKEFCDLLREFDDGKDPTNLLVERLDELLMSIAR